MEWASGETERAEERIDAIAELDEERVARQNNEVLEMMGMPLE